MAQILTVTEVTRRFAEYINRVAYCGERFILTRGKKQIAELRPLPTGRKLSELPTLFASLPHLSHEDAESFAKDIRAAHISVIKEDYDPWER